MNWSVGTKIGGGFALALAALAIIGVFSYRSTSTLAEASELKSHTYVVLRNLKDLPPRCRMRRPASAATSLRAGRTIWNPTTRGSRPKVSLVDELRKLTADNPNQQRSSTSSSPWSPPSSTISAPSICARTRDSTQPRGDPVEQRQAGDGRSAR